MAIGFISGADHSSSSGDGDINGPDPNSEEARRNRLGYTGVDGPDVSIAGPDHQDANPDWSPNGQGEAIEGGYRQQGTNAYDQDVNRYRSMGAAGMSRQGATLDQTDANQSRGFQLGALGLMNTAAQGGAPSRAVELSHAANDSAIRGAVGSTGGARGPGASVAAMNQAQTGAATRMAGQNAQLTDMRGAEMAQNQQQFAGAAQGARAQDIAAAEANAKNEAIQRQLNEQRQHHFEQLGYDTRHAQQQAADRSARDQANQDNTRIQNQQSRDARDWEHTTDDAKTGISMMMAASDDRAKTNIHPITMGSLSGLSRFMHGRR